MTLNADAIATLEPATAEAESAIRTALDAGRDQIIALSHEIGADPELAFEEHRAAERVAQLLENNGFSVTRGAYGLDTAIEGVYGDGALTVAVVAEYDALPGVGHACGHNMIAASGVGAAIALASVADRLGLRVKLLGSPAEELGGGKILMLRAGAWNDAALSLMVHGATGDQHRTSAMRTMALERIIVRFTGRPAHAAGAPFEGVNAGDAVVLTQVAIGLLRQQLKGGTVVSSFVQNAGVATNIIPAHAEMEIEMRSADAEDWAFARRRVRECIDGAVQATGCQVQIELPELPYGVLRQDVPLSEHFDDVLRELGYDVKEPPASSAGGSTDMADVSQYLPAIHPMITVRDSDAVPHTPEFAATAVSAEGDQAVLDGAYALAVTVARTAADAQRRAELLAAQAEREPFVWED